MVSNINLKLDITTTSGKNVYVVSNINLRLEVTITTYVGLGILLHGWSIKSGEANTVRVKLRFAQARENVRSVWKLKGVQDHR